MSTVNISHLGNEAEVQLAEALVAVSEAVVAAAAEVEETPRVVAVEETTHSDDAVMQQVNLFCRKLISLTDLETTVGTERSLPVGLRTGESKLSVLYLSRSSSLNSAMM